MVLMMQHTGNYLGKKNIKSDRVKKDVNLKGVSGIKHHFKYVLCGDCYSIAVDISDSRDIEIDIIKLYIKCMDTGIRNAILIVGDDVSINNKLR